MSIRYAASTCILLRSPLAPKDLGPRLTPRELPGPPQPLHPTLLPPRRPTKKEKKKTPLLDQPKVDPNLASMTLPSRSPTEV